MEFVVFTIKNEKSFNYSFVYRYMTNVICNAIFFVSDLFLISFKDTEFY